MENCARWTFAEAYFEIKIMWCNKKNTYSKNIKLLNDIKNFIMN